jgi:hypothetical protein
MNVLDVLAVEAEAIYMMDRGHLDFERLFTMHQAGAFFVTRAKLDMDAWCVYPAPVDRSSGVICDQCIMPNGSRSAVATIGTNAIKLSPGPKRSPGAVAGKVGAM